MQLKVLDLFSGIGGFSLGLERAGMKTIAFCEVDKKCQLVLKKHWPEIPIFDDIKILSKELFNEHVDIICGGFPCQDISCAGKGAGLSGEKSGLWYEFRRCIKEFKPQYAIIENVSALRNRGLSTLLQELHALGYDAEWHCIPAFAVGAPHQRDRIWIVAYSTQKLLGQKQEVFTRWNAFNLCGENMANADGARCERQWSLSLAIEQELTKLAGNGWWKTEPSVGRVVDGLSGRVDRLKQLGNSLVPQIAEVLGMAIMSSQQPQKKRG